ncbi:MAG TPA: hypothetical protein VN783_01565, partial [Thermoanaerobaculia bacterium]|nr:hypothetical protein [Thermoanaerobaculia bacterium]
ASREIEASIYSLPSAFFSAGEARRFLAAVHAAAPRRELLVLADPGMRRALAGLPSLPGVRTLPTFGRPYSPWPRDPMSLVRRPGGGFALLLRPNLQRGREEDASLGRALAAALPGDLDRRWGHPRWATAAVPFHNGQVLLTGDAAWITIHTLEPRILALLGLERVPVESFRSAEGLDRYLTAARAAAAELSALYGRPARFVHPLPEAGDPAARLTAMRDLGGGAGIDLDSIVTLLPAASETSGGRQRALVADLSLGRGLLATATAADFASLRLGYGLAADLDPARGLESTLGSERALALGRFLDATAGELSAQGFEVRRLPLLLVPFTFLADAAGLPPDGSFLIGWNNAVLETRNGELRAEAFASLIPAGDRAASATYGALGTHLELLPALPKSVVLGGGYRCASNHVRR